MAYGKFQNRWKTANSKVLSYASGLLNIDTKGAKFVINYKVSERPEGYKVFISGMEHTSPFSSFFIKSVEGNNMQVTLRNANSGKTFTLIKTKDIPFGIIPLEVKNQEL